MEVIIRGVLQQSSGLDHLSNQDNQSMPQRLISSLEPNLLHQQSNKIQGQLRFKLLGQSHELTHDFLSVFSLDVEIDRIGPDQSGAAETDILLEIEVA